MSKLVDQLRQFGSRLSNHFSLAVSKQVLDCSGFQIYGDSYLEKIVASEQITKDLCPTSCNNAETDGATMPQRDFSSLSCLFCHLSMSSSTVNAKHSFFDVFGLCTPGGPYSHSPLGIHLINAPSGWPQTFFISILVAIGQVFFSCCPFCCCLIIYSSIVVPSSCCHCYHFCILVVSLVVLVLFLNVRIVLFVD